MLKKAKCLFWLITKIEKMKEISLFLHQKVNAKKINFMAKHGRGLICLALFQQKVKN